MLDIEEIKQATARWERCTMAIESAIADRDFRRLRHTIEHGNIHYRHLHRLLVTTDNSAMSPALRAHIVAVTQRWLDLVPPLGEWQQHVRQEFDDARKQRRATKRVKSAYKPVTGESGRTVRVAAR